MRQQEFDRIYFKDEEEAIQYLRNSTENFDIVDFYSQTDDASAFILISPYQNVVAFPVAFHYPTKVQLLQLLFDVGFDEDNWPKEDNLNNIYIRLSRGKSVLFIPMIPDVMTVIQSQILKNYLDKLANYRDFIPFDNEYELNNFDTYYKYAVDKLNTAIIVDDFVNIEKDRYIISDHSLKK